MMGVQTPVFAGFTGDTALKGAVGNWHIVVTNASQEKA